MFFEEEFFISELIVSNPEYYQTYTLAGDYYYTFGKLEKAGFFYKKALTKEFENTVFRSKIEENLKEIEEISKKK